MSEYPVAKRFVMATLDRFLQSRQGTLHDAMIAELDAWQHEHEIVSLSIPNGSSVAFSAEEVLSSKTGALISEERS